MITGNVFDAYEVRFSDGTSTVLSAKDENQARQIIKVLLPSASIEMTSRVGNESTIAA